MSRPKPRPAVARARANRPAPDTLPTLLDSYVDRDDDGIHTNATIVRTLPAHMRGQFDPDQAPIAERLARKHGMWDAVQAVIAAESPRPGA